MRYRGPGGKVGQLSSSGGRILLRLIASSSPAVLQTSCTEVARVAARSSSYTLGPSVVVELVLCRSSVSPLWASPPSPSELTRPGFPAPSVFPRIRLKHWTDPKATTTLPLLWSMRFLHPPQTVSTSDGRVGVSDGVETSPSRRCEWPCECSCGGIGRGDDISNRTSYEERDSRQGKYQAQRERATVRWVMKGRRGPCLNRSEDKSTPEQEGSSIKVRDPRPIEQSV